MCIYIYIYIYIYIHTHIYIYTHTRIHISHTGDCEKQVLWRRGPLGRSAFRAPSQGWKGVAAAGAQGKGSRNNIVSFADTVMTHDIWVAVPV